MYTSDKHISIHLQKRNEELVKLNFGLHQIFKGLKSFSKCTNINSFAGSVLIELSGLMAADGGCFYIKSKSLKLLFSKGDVDEIEKEKLVKRALRDGKHIILFEESINKHIAVFPISDESNREAGAILIYRKNYPFEQYNIETGLIIASYCCETIRAVTAVEALKVSEEQHRFLTDNATDCIWTMNMEKRMTYVSPSIMNLLGYSVSEMKKLIMEDYITAKSLPIALDMFSFNQDFESNKTEPVKTFELQYIKKNSTTIWVETKVSFLDVLNGHPLGIMGVTRDISERKRQRDKLKSALDEVKELKNRIHAENIYLQEEIRGACNYENMVGKNAGFEGVLEKVGKVAPTSATVLILGETGTGKELIARAIHSNSNRRRRPLVKVNCAVLPENLIESELFGHERGAFTGANERRIGRFELADGGTIFLDEIGELPLELQAKLLRVLQEGSFERLGSPHTINVDVRIIAATNRNLERSIQKGEFRRDLFYRLNIFPLECPPLRERKDDIPVLVWHFLEKHCLKSGRNVKKVTETVMDMLINYSWPGNIRELENVIERAIILSGGSLLEVELEEHPVFYSTSEVEVANDKHVNSLSYSEKNALKHALDTCDWKVEGKHGAATLLKIPPSTLRWKMKKHGLNRPHV